MLRDFGFDLEYRYEERNRTGDHICYISDLSKLRSHFPGWQMEFDIPAIISGIAERHLAQIQVPA